METLTPAAHACLDQLGEYQEDLVNLADLLDELADPLTSPDRRYREVQAMARNARTRAAAAERRVEELTDAVDADEARLQTKARWSVEAVRVPPITSAPKPTAGEDPATSPAALIRRQLMHAIAKSQNGTAPVFLDAGADHADLAELLRKGNRGHNVELFVVGCHAEPEPHCVVGTRVAPPLRTGPPVTNGVDVALPGAERAAAYTIRPVDLSEGAGPWPSHGDGAAKAPLPDAVQVVVALDSTPMRPFGVEVAMFVGKNARDVEPHSVRTNLADFVEPWCDATPPRPTAQAMAMDVGHWLREELGYEVSYVAVVEPDEDGQLSAARVVWDKPRHVKPTA